MEITSTFSINVVGSESGNVYTGDFKVRTMLTLRQQAMADEIRRAIIGSNGAMVSQGIANLAVAASQLAVRIVEGPQWWAEAGQGGIDLSDENVLGELFKLTMKAESDRKNRILSNSKAAEKKLKKKDSKIESEEDEE